MTALKHQETYPHKKNIVLCVFVVIMLFSACSSLKKTNKPARDPGVGNMAR
jgi:uncharacterized lipoprotein